MRSAVIHKIVSVVFEENVMIVVAGDQQYQWEIADVSKRLLNASESDRNNYKISPSGYGIHWPSIDEDLSLNGLLAINPKSKRG